jgi:hypothetical protein
VCADSGRKDEARPGEHPLGLVVRLLVGGAIIAFGVLVLHTWLFLAPAVVGAGQVAWERRRFRKTGWARTPARWPNESGLQQMRRERRERSETRSGT